MSLFDRMQSSLVGIYLGPGAELRRKLGRARQIVTFQRRQATYYHQPDDPYGALMLQLLPGLIARYPIDLRFVVVPEPAADVDPEPELRAKFAVADAIDLSRYYDLSFPSPAAEISASRMRRAEAVLLVERPVAEQLRVARAVSEALFGGDGAALRRILEQEGSAPGQSIRPQLEESYAKLRAAGHYRGGVVHYGGEWFLGPERLARLEERLAQEGLAATEPLLRRRPSPSFEALPTRGPDGRFELEFFHSFVSPYAYLAAARLRRMTERFPLEVRLRTIVPVRTRGVSTPRAKLVFIAHDAKREADRLGIPFGRIQRPRYAGVRRCAAVAVLAEERGLGLAFAEAAGRAIWAEGVDVATDEGLRPVVESVGLDWASARAALDRPDLDEVLEAHRVAQHELGLWGFPVFRLGDYHTWGQDRLEPLEARLEAAMGRAASQAGPGAASAQGGR